MARGVKNHPSAFLITKGGMARPGGGWRPDGRAQSLRRDAEEGVEALGRPSDLFLLHAPDPRVPWETSVRALAAIGREGLAARTPTAPLTPHIQAVAPLESRSTRLIPIGKQKPARMAIGAMQATTSAQLGLAQAPPQLELPMT